MSQVQVPDGWLLVCMLQSKLMANLDRVIQQLREERDRLDRAIVTLQSIGGNSTVRSAGRGVVRRRFSPAAIAKMRAAQRARRARERSGRRAVPRANHVRRKISPEGLARIRAGQRKRWAKVRAGTKK